MEILKGLLMYNNFNRLSFVAVISWIVFGVTLLGVFLEMDNGEPRFSCSEKSENMDLVAEKCLQQYEDSYNQFGFPLYAFEAINIFLIFVVCVVYSELVVMTINLNAEGSRSLFVAYCCQLAIRLVLGILFPVLETQLFYPSNFPTIFNCNLTLTGGSPAANASDANIQNTTTYECHNQRAGSKTFGKNALIYLNGVFAFIVLTELIWIFLRAKKDGRLMENLHFSADHLKTANKVHPQEELKSFVKTMQENVKKYTEKPVDLKALLPSSPGEGEKNKDLSIDEIYTYLHLHPKRAEYDFPKDREERLKVFVPEVKRQEGVDPEKPKGPEDIVEAENLQPIRLKDIVDANKKVLIVGRPGIGKSLFCTKVLRELAMGSQNTEIQYNVAFLVKFRKFNRVAENLSLRELLAKSEYMCSQTEFPDGVWTNIHKNSEKVLILLDGLNEFRDIQGILEEPVNNDYHDSVEEKMPPAALFSKITKGRLLPGATVVTTARPTTVSRLAGHIDFNRVFEIVGFPTRQVEEYVKKFGKNAAENSREVGEIIKQYISTNMNLFSLCYVPENCFIICSCLLKTIVYNKKKGKDLPDAVLSKKFTQIYKIAMRLFFLRHNERYKDKAPEKKDKISDKLPPEVEENIFKPLRKVALSGVEEGRLTFLESEVTGLEDSGLLYQLTPCKNDSYEDEAKFCFIHLTFQEFLAARHIVDTMKDETQLKGFVSDHIIKVEWHVVFQFVAGLLGEQKRPIEIFTDCLPKKTEKKLGFTWWPHENEKHLALTIVKCLYEHEDTQQTSNVQNKLEKTGFNALDFSHCALASSDCTAVVYVLQNIQRISCINLSYNHIGSLGCVEIRKLLNNCNRRLTRLDLQANNIDDDGVLKLCEVITNSKLTKLDLSRNKITDVSVNELNNVLTNSNCNLTELQLLHNKEITDKAKQKIRSANSKCTVSI